MIRKYHNYTQQTTPCIAKNSHTTIMRHQEDKKKQSNQLSLHYQDYCKTRMDTLQCTTNIEQLWNPTTGVTINNESTTNQQQQNHRLRIAICLSHWAT